MENLCLQRDWKKAVDEREKVPRLLGAERFKQENSAVIEQINEEIPTVTTNVAEELGALAMLLEHGMKEVVEMKKEREAATWKWANIARVGSGLTLSETDCRGSCSLPSKSGRNESTLSTVRKATLFSCMSV